MVIQHDLDPFFQSVLKLKSVKRAGWVSNLRVQNPESVADHTFAMCAVAMLFGDMLGHDTARIMRMVILHDLAESVVGDYMPGDVSASEKYQQEKRAMGDILNGLPPQVRSQYLGIWNEYLENNTAVAQFVHRIDKLEMAMQAGNYARQGYDRELLAPFFASARTALEVGKQDVIAQTLARFSSIQ